MSNAKYNRGVFDRGEPDFCVQPRSKPLKVMILGLCRTGTTSMLEAMEVLGYGTTYNSRESLRRHHESFLARGIDALSEDACRSKFDLEQFESVFADYAAISGEAVQCFAPDLITAYPDAKVILTTRGNSDSEVDAWYESVYNTLWYNHTHPFQRLLFWIHPRYWELGKLIISFWKSKFWNDFRTHGRRVYREHNAMVQRLVQPERLLVYNVNDGWEPLCQFLRNEIPDQPFPHANKQSEHRQLFARGRRKAYSEIAFRMTPILLAGAIAWAQRANVERFITGLTRV